MDIISIELKEHRLCVKIIRHFFANVYDHGRILENFNDYGPITKEELETLNYLVTNGVNHIHGYDEIPEFYYLFFKYVMDIEGNLFKLKAKIKNKKSLINELAPNYDYVMYGDENLCINKWEKLKLSTDEYELSSLLNNNTVNEIFSDKSRKQSEYYEYHENRKRVKILDKKVESIILNFENINIV